MARFGKRPRRIGEVLRAKVAQAAAHRLPVAIASSSVGAACPAVANAHATLARSCALNSRRPRRTACVAIASSSTGAAWPAVANAHEAVMESSCGLKSRRPPRTASVAIASSSNGAARPALANAHATLARSCGLKSRRPPRTASLAIASKSVGAARSALAKAHAVLASSCGLKSRRSPRTAAVAIARRAAPAQRGRRCGKRPRHVGEVLRVELAQPRHRLRGDRVEQHRRSVAGRRKRPHAVFARVKAAQPATHRRLRHPPQTARQPRCPISRAYTWLRQAMRDIRQSPCVARVNQLDRAPQQPPHYRRTSSLCLCPAASALLPQLVPHIGSRHMCM